MTKCDRCGKEVGNLYCGHCRIELQKETKVEPQKLIPLLYWDEANKCYRAGCQCFGCPCNQKGVCGVRSLPPLENLKLLLHEFDGDNIIHQVCG